MDGRMLAEFEAWANANAVKPTQFEIWKAAYQAGQKAEREEVEKSRMVARWEYNALVEKLERTQEQLAAAKAASVVPVEIVSVEDADLDHGYNIDVGIQCKSEADADILLDWLRDRTKERSEG